MLDGYGKILDFFFYGNQHVNKKEQHSNTFFSSSISILPQSEDEARPNDISSISILPQSEDEPRPGDMSRISILPESEDEARPNDMSTDVAGNINPQAQYKRDSKRD